MKFFWAGALIGTGLGLGMWWWVLGPVDRISREEILVIPEREIRFEAVDELVNLRLIKNEAVFSWLLTAFGSEPKPGGYRLKATMSQWRILKIISSEPQLVWVTVREGWRQEQIGEALARKLGWNRSETEEWNSLAGEGQFFPDTYLVPRDEPVDALGQRMQSRFEEKFGAYLEKATQKNIRWTTVIKIASLLEREAAGEHDMPLISGIVWNRLERGMRLQVDATLQYIKGKEGDWWPTVVPQDKNLISPFNTYRHGGLPPAPIANPGLAAIEAALNPQETDCLYYLHADKRIYCSPTYAGHLENIKRYLSN